jgi:hydrogenase maturation factor
MDRTGDTRVEAVNRPLNFERLFGVVQRVRVVLETEIGGERLLDELEDDPLPRIC